MLVKKQIASLIDHALLKPNLTDKEITDGCKLAVKYQVASVCVRPSDVSLASEILAGSPVKVTTVIGFPHGTTSSRAKLEESKEAIANGAVELDVVLNIGKLKSGHYEYVYSDLQPLMEHSHNNGVKVKVIFEICYLTDEEIIKACEICNRLQADWVKTSTGFGPGVATPHAVALMRKHAKPEIQVKASGGIHTLEQAIAYKELGCTRLGASATEAILLDK